MQSVIVPRAPANFSAWGIVCSDYREDNSRTLVRPFNAEHLEEMLDSIAAMKQENLDRLRHYGFENRNILSDRWPGLPGPYGRQEKRSKPGGQGTPVLPSPATDMPYPSITGMTWSGTSRSLGRQLWKNGPPPLPFRRVGHWLWTGLETLS